MRAEESSAARSTVPPVASGRPAVLRAVGRYYFGTASAVALLLAVAIQAAPVHLAAPWGRLLTIALVAYAAACLVAFFAGARSRFPINAVLVLAGSGAMGLTVLSALALGDGLRQPTLGLGALVVCVVCSVTNLRWGTLLAIVCAASIGFLAWAQTRGWTIVPPQGTPLALALAIQWALIGCGLAGGALLTRVLARYLATADQREHRYHTLFQRSPSPLMLHRQGIVMEANEAAARMFGVQSIEDLIGFDVRSAYVDQDSLVRLRQRMKRLEHMPPGEHLPVEEFRLRSRRGDDRIVQATATRVDTGQGMAILSIYFDVTERVTAEAALRRSQSLLAHLIETSPDLITLTDLGTGRYELVNRTFERVTGYNASEVVGRTSSDIAIWYDRTYRDKLVDVIRRDGHADDLPAVVRTKSGEPVAVRLSGARFTMEGLDYLVLNGRDVTSTEQARLEHEAILQNVSIGIAFTRKRVFQHTNPSFDRMFGWQPGQLAGQDIGVIWPHQDDYDAMRSEALPALSRGEAYELERTMRRADGTLFWCRMRGQALQDRVPGAGTIWIAEDVSERRQVDQALADARDAAEAASRAKSTFLANTSHEIRTPLHGLLGLARLAMREGLDEGRRRQYLAQIVDSANTLSNIISDILDLSRIEAGKLPLESVAFGLHETLQAVHAAYRPLAESKGLALTLSIDDEVPDNARGDPVRVRQVLTNFVTNALKFTERGSIRIDASPAPDERVRLSVTDTGPGIDAATQQRLFQPFSQADDSTTRRYGGTGLGLSICREIAHLLGGDVGVLSQPGAGSTFWVELPLPAADAAETGHGALDALADRLVGARILLVEDNAVNMMIAVAMLEQWGVDVMQAFDGRMAIDAVDQAAREGRPFDAVVMDVQMPVMSGHEAARRLRERFGPQQLPIVALTAAALVSEREQALSSGMNDFLTKPVDAQRLKETLLRLLYLHRTRGA